MSENKRRRQSYAAISREEKDRTNARKRNARQREQEANANLIPIAVQEDHTMFTHSDANRTKVNYPNQADTGHGASSNASQGGPSIPDSPGLLYDVPIGVTNYGFIPAPPVPQRSIPNEAYVLQPLNPCKYCNAKLFPYESARICCCQGEVRLYPTVIPPELQELYTGQGASSVHFRKYIRPYNNAFAFTSFGVHLDPRLSKRLNGVFTFRAQGQVYHFLNGLIPSNREPTFLQLYFFDTEHEVTNRKGCKSNLDDGVIEQLIHLLQPNPYSTFFRNLQNVPDLENCQIKLKANLKVHSSTADVPHVSQVGAIWYENEENTDTTEREILVYNHDGHSQRIQYYYGCYDPLQYPLLFPHGEPGWHQGIKKHKVQHSSPTATDEPPVAPVIPGSVEELLRTEQTAYAQRGNTASMVSAREFYAYRLQIRTPTQGVVLYSGRLLQQFIVDMYIKIESSRLDYFRNNQVVIRAELYQGIVDSVRHGESDAANIGKRIILPGSFIGGPRDMRKRFLDAMALVEHYGKPDIFLTMTCNPNWPEIKDELQPFEEVQNRPDLLTRIFRSKFEQLRKEVIKGELFGPIAAYTYVIEFQKRGLPHAHMLLILRKPHKLVTADMFDAFISAELPDEATQPHLYTMVKKHMMHGPCGMLNPQNPCMENGCCKNHYPKDYCTKTTISHDGYPLYRRQQTNNKVMVRGQTLDNAWVVPYNPYLLARFDCHINVEACSTVKAVKYLYKYIYKGHDKIIYKVVASKDNEHIDEIEQFQSARWVSPPESAWRIYKFPLYDMYPAVITLQLHLEGFHTVAFQETSSLRTIAETSHYSKSMLTEFFWMNANDNTARDAKLLYKKFPEKFVWLTSQRRWKQRQRGEAIGRIITSSPTQGEQYYLRLLLNYVPAPTSYIDLRTVKGTIHSSFREAAMAYGLLEDDSSKKNVCKRLHHTKCPSL